MPIYVHEYVPMCVFCTTTTKTIEVLMEYHSYVACCLCTIRLLI